MINHTMRKLRGELSQRDLAKELGIPQSTYAMIETNQRFPRRDLQMKLANYFDVTVDELFFNQIDHESRSKTNSA
ncbi:helix-turn-helix transcriptional regulator [Aureibacillus halotolerans]|uniref:DNA-binding XRE family transcriptional regulator n=1 Tax=Aureibacillus halotolerans TaxID=1508390 RepID=A0A4R6TRZ9_9BACI|nr:helix-turn-helix transcriptional regulator [Aureibacillus halotolerans]TDQ35237.1 DNA-binding XRE family transcriptional regulator [Aureibacillus halotolerans]